MSDNQNTKKAHRGHRKLGLLLELRYKGLNGTECTSTTEKIEARGLPIRPKRIGLLSEVTLIHSKRNVFQDIAT